MTQEEVDLLETIEFWRRRYLEILKENRELRRRVQLAQEELFKRL